jgi:predicted lipid carrier protein YhbT
MQIVGHFGTAGQLVLNVVHRAAYAALRHVLHPAAASKAQRPKSCAMRPANFRDATILVEPTDQPIAFLLRFGPPHLLEIASSKAGKEATATIRGPFKSLIGLLEGRLNSDALVLSGEVSVSGSMQLVLAVRNTADDGNIDLLHDLMAAGSPREARHMPPRAA